MSASNPIRWSYDTLVESFDVYHAGPDPPRGLLDFSQQLSSFRPEKRSTTSTKKMKTEKVQVSKTKSPQAPELRAPRSSARVSELPARERPTGRNGPVPKAFELQPTQLPDEVPEEADMEQLTPEQYADWMKYYRECAEYFEECERNCAEQARTVHTRRAQPGLAPSASASSRPQAPQAPQVNASPFPLNGKAFDSPSWASLMPPPLPEGAPSPAPLLQALQTLQLLQQQQQLQQLQLQSVQQLISGSLLSGSMFGMPLPKPEALGLNNETLMNLLMAWYYSGYYTGEYAAKQGKI
ncbi:unnamed protein product [Durusdinium trenchii]|uniref:Survival motor neuron Tudor domain-containing protein n=1 Tax=Durusdinium trenchii TaxID=1381693 RepID=A0ABP0MJL3_9DINO